LAKAILLKFIESTPNNHRGLKVVAIITNHFGNITLIDFQIII